MSKKGRFKTQYFDFGLLITVILLLAFGMVMLYSTSAYNATIKFGDGTHYVMRQFKAALLGFAMMYFFVKVDYRFWKRFALLAYVASIILCIAVIFAGNEKYGASRWFSIGGINFQPSELAKVAVILLLATLIGKSDTALKGSKNVLKVFGIIIPLVAVVAYNNLSTAVIILGITYIMLFVASKETRVFVSFVFLAFVGVMAIIIFGQGYRMARIDAWQHPEKYDEGYQTLQALYAIGSGGLFGKGLGESFQKSFVPEAQNDMIFSIICEELGIFGAICVIVLYLILIWRLMVIAINAKDKTGGFICVGVMAHIAIQVILNIGVVTNTIPNTGITLPFISYGGTSILILLSEMGLALGVSKYIEPK
ncbi:MAG: putative lipid II flippase FtsW [Lachnospiraceae bacterium]|nr:putative lipid II flippase FtsW [Lachnospiraceae bacterium]